ncbi:HNH endonuclease [Amycolatopsis azurea]|uniref:HNH endonuclease n=1 Tax=Amycolatopsis azurea TaxID=36819 RepID=UPI00380A3FA6
MNSYLLPSILILGVALPGIVLLAILAGRRRRYRDPRRFFRRADRQVIALRAGGRCEHKPPLWRRCREPGTEADHITPWSRGGLTALWNGQLLCHRHNSRKSNTVPGPVYRWRLTRRRRKY